MNLLCGWKEIAEHLHLTVRTAQRWERLGLPVRRVSNSARSPVVAIPAEIDLWARAKKVKGNGYDCSLASMVAEFRATRRKTRKIVKQLVSARHEHQRLLKILHDQIQPKKRPDS